jgi:hypothetical protein
VPGLNRSRAYRSDPCGRGWAESFLNYFGPGLRPWRLSQFQLEDPTPRRTDSGDFSTSAQVWDGDDQRVLAAAVAVNADVLVTGTKTCWT